MGRDANKEKLSGSKRFQPILRSTRSPVRPSLAFELRLLLACGSFREVAKLIGRLNDNRISYETYKVDSVSHVLP
eukprot:3024862-Amphidinium_carterae.1